MISSRRPLASLAIAVASLNVCCAAAAIAGSPYDGWRGQSALPEPQRVGSPYVDRRPFDGSSRFATPTSMWTGLYAGIHLGGGWGTMTPDSVAANNVDLSGFLGGGQLGYNIQMGSFVAGLELDASRSGIDGKRTFNDPVSITAQMDWTSSLRLRLGYAFGQFLIYGTGGLAFGGLGLDATSASINSSDHERLFGYAVGGGVEMKLTTNLSARVEALHYGFGRKTFDTSAGPRAIDADATTVRAGLSWHFN